jgi:hypothetical protein
MTPEGRDAYLEKILTVGFEQATGRAPSDLGPGVAPWDSNTPGGGQNNSNRASGGQSTKETCVLQQVIDQHAKEKLNEKCVQC